MAKIIKKKLVCHSVIFPRCLTSRD